MKRSGAGRSPVNQAHDCKFFQTQTSSPAALDTGGRDARPAKQAVFHLEEPKGEAHFMKHEKWALYTGMESDDWRRD